MYEELKSKMLLAFDRLVDDRIDMYGMRNTIAWLMDQCDFNKEDLLASRFEEEDIDYVIENPEADYSQWN